MNRLTMGSVGWKATSPSGSPASGAVPVNPVFTLHEVADVFSDAGVKMIVAVLIQYPRMEAVRQRSPREF